MASFEVFAPGRLCLFGEHQDYLGLPVIAVAIDRGVRATVEPRPGAATLEVELPDVGEHDAIARDGSSDPLARDGGARWLRAAVAELRAEGAALPTGARIVVRSDLPGNAGCGSSSALVVAFVRALIELAGASASPLAAPERLAEIAWRAEVARFGGPGGRMDPVTSAFGGLVQVGFDPGLTVQRLAAPLDGLVLIESGESKATGEVLARTRAAVERAFADLARRGASFELAALSYDDAWNLLTDAREDETDPTAHEERERLVFATLFDRDLLLVAARVLEQSPLDAARLGELLDEHHERLRDGLRVSTPRLEELRSMARGAGALGVKLIGSGGGGALVAWAPGREAEVIAAVAERGGRGSIVKPGAGARVTSPGRA